MFFALIFNNFDVPKSKFKRVVVMKNVLHTFLPKYLIVLNSNFSKILDVPIVLNIFYTPMMFTENDTILLDQY